MSHLPMPDRGVALIMVGSAAVVAVMEALYLQHAPHTILNAVRQSQR